MSSAQQFETFERALIGRVVRPWVHERIEGVISSISGDNFVVRGPKGLRFEIPIADVMKGKCPLAPSGGE